MLLLLRRTTGTMSRSASSVASARAVVVDATNFDALLPEIASAIKGASFIAFDGEFSGLWRESAFKGTALDSLDSRYAKARDAARHIALLQFGLCTFTPELGARPLQHLKVLS